MVVDIFCVIMGLLEQLLLHKFRQNMAYEFLFNLCASVKRWSCIGYISCALVPHCWSSTPLASALLVKAI